MKERIHTIYTINRERERERESEGYLLVLLVLNTYFFSMFITNHTVFFTWVLTMIKTKGALFVNMPAISTCTCARHLIQKNENVCEINKKQLDVICVSVSLCTQERSQIKQIFKNRNIPWSHYLEGKA